MERGKGNNNKKGNILIYNTSPVFPCWVLLDITYPPKIMQFADNNGQSAEFMEFVCLFEKISCSLSCVGFVTYGN